MVRVITTDGKTHEYEKADGWVVGPAHGHEGPLVFRLTWTPFEDDLGDVMLPFDRVVVIANATEDNDA